MTKRAGFHFRLLFSAFLLIGGAVFALGYLGLAMIQDFAQARFDERNRLMAGNLARNCEVGLLIEDRTMLQRLAVNLLSEPDVTRVTVFNAAGQALADVSKELQGPTSTVNVPVHLRRIDEEGLVQQLVSQNRDLAVIGSVKVVFSLEEMNRLHQGLRNRFVLLALGVGCLALILFYFISKSLLTPVNRLAQTARKVAQGDRDVRAVPDRIPETRALAEAFNSMLDSLDWSAKALEEAYQEMMRQKTLAEFGRFAMVIAHEVKNPLGIIKTSLDCLKKDLGVGRENTMVYYIEDEIRRLNQLIEDFLAFSRPARPSFRKVELNALLLDCVTRFQMQVASDAVEIRCDIPENSAVSSADADLLTRAFSNLLKNALEAQDGRGTIAVRCGRDGPFWWMEVRDAGPGIPNDILHRIFEPFFTTKSQGTGLGLAFVSQVVAAHGGDVRAENAEGGGAVFAVQIPIR